MKVCPNGHEVSDNVKFCPTCGVEIISGNRFCTKCGSERKGTENFCSHCGTPFGNMSGQKTILEEQAKKSNYKIIFYVLGTIASIVICGGVLNYCNSPKETNGQSFIDSTADADNGLLSVENVIDIYKTKNKEYIRQVLKANGYTLFKSDGHDEYWTKNVQLKGVKDWRGETIYEPTEKKGSCISLMGSDDYFDVVASVYSNEDFEKWINQLKKMGYREKSYEEKPSEKDGWTILGAHGNYFKLYEDDNGNSIEFMKSGEDCFSYSVYSINEYNQEYSETVSQQVDIMPILNECQNEITAIQREIEDACRTFVVLGSQDVDIYKYTQMKSTFLNGVSDLERKADKAFDKCARELQEAGYPDAVEKVNEEKRQFHSAIYELTIRATQQTDMSY